jgi:signal transduction histidine kinase
LATRSARSDPGTAFLRRVRTSLTLWYGAVLAITLAVSGLVLYFGLQDLLTRPIARFLDGVADVTADRWQQSPGTCPPPEEGRRPSGEQPEPPRPPVRRPLLYIACMDPHGRIVGAFTVAPDATAPPPDAFLDRALLQRALRDGRARDIVDGGEEIGPIYRVAVAVTSPPSVGVVGVVLAGRAVASEIGALRLLRDLLLTIAAAAVLVATLGGLFLAHRALDPARTALARQQTFIGDASHELRAPLTLIRANADVLLRHRDDLTPDDAALLDDIIIETEHMDRLTTNLLTLARLDAERLRLAREPVDLADVARDVVRRLTPLAGRKGISVREECQTGVEVLGDRQALEQAVMILADNAVKYTPPGGRVTIRTFRRNGQAGLAVEDTGVGIPPEHLPRLGERFYRADPARARDGGGAGLGLAIAFGIAAAHGGSIRIASAPGEGTRAVLQMHAPSRRAVR